MISIKEKYIEQIRSYCKNVFGKKKVTVVLFGSRARGDCRDSSDIDLAVFSEISVKIETSLLREAFDQSTIPYHFDIVEMDETTEQLMQAVKKEGVIIWKN